MTMTASDLYTRIADTFVADPSLESALLENFEATVAERFGIALPKPARLARTESGFRLSYDGKDYDLGDPRHATKGELNDAELELVSAGSDNECATTGHSNGSSPDGNFPSVPMPTLPPL